MTHNNKQVWLHGQAVFSYVTQITSVISSKRMDTSRMLAVSITAAPPPAAACYMEKQWENATIIVLCKINLVTL